MCSSEILARLALTICPTLEKLRSNVALLAATKMHFWTTCTTIENLREAWAQYLREFILGGGIQPFIIEVAHLTFYQI